MLYGLVQCPHRATMDLFEDEAKCDPTYPFLELLWEKGQAYEQEVKEGLENRPPTPETIVLMYQKPAMH